MNSLVDRVETEHSFSVLLEYAADNDVEGFKRLVCNESEVWVVGLWYVHRRFSKKLVLEHRTPLMIAAKYGSVDVVKLILQLPEVDVNFSCGSDKCTALHCAASGGSANAFDVVKLLLLAGADPNSSNANGHLPVDVIAATPSFPSMKLALEELLKKNGSACLWDDLQVSTGSLRSGSPPSPWSSEEVSLSSASGSLLPLVNFKALDAQVSSVKKEYPVDPSLPDMKNSVYTTDEFRMFSFKIQPCSRAYSHDWTECPFVHPGENARRRDLRRFSYSCVPCPDHRKGACRRGDMCEYSHGIFECWLHPAQYRTRLCKDGTGCSRRVCFFAHTNEELRSLCAPTDAPVPSPQAAAGDYSAALNFLPGSPSAASTLSRFTFTPPMSPTSNDIHLSMAWRQQNTSNLQILGNNLQASRLRTFSGRYVPSEEFGRFQDFELQQLQLRNEMSCFSQPEANISSSNISAHLKQLQPSNLDRLLTSEVSSPQTSDQLDVASMFYPFYESALDRMQQQSMPSPLKTSVFSGKNVGCPLFQTSFDSSLLRMMSPRISEPISSASSHLASLAHKEKLQVQLGSPSSRELSSDLTYDLGFNDVDSQPKEKPANKNVDWSIQADEVGQLQNSCSKVLSGEEPDVSWVQSVLKESASETEESLVLALVSAEGSSPNPPSDSDDHAGLPAWFEGMQLDRIVA